MKVNKKINNNMNLPSKESVMKHKEVAKNKTFSSKKYDSLSKYINNILNKRKKNNLLSEKNNEVTNLFSLLTEEIFWDE